MTVRIYYQVWYLFWKPLTFISFYEQNQVSGPRVVLSVLKCVLKQDSAH